MGSEWYHTSGTKLAIFIKSVGMERVAMHASNSIACTVASDPEVMWHITASAVQLADAQEHTQFVVRTVVTKPSLMWPQQTGVQC